LFSREKEKLNEENTARMENTFRLTTKQHYSLNFASGKIRPSDSFETRLSQVQRTTIEACGVSEKHEEF